MLVQECTNTYAYTKLLVVQIWNSIFNQYSSFETIEF